VRRQRERLREREQLRAVRCLLRERELRQEREQVLRQEREPQTCHMRRERRPESLPRAGTFSFGILLEGIKRLINRGLPPRRLLVSKLP
jgi:hypothetical protein